MSRRLIIAVVAGLLVLTNVITALVVVLVTRSPNHEPALRECESRLDMKERVQRLSDESRGKVRDQMVTQQGRLVLCLIEAKTVREAKDCVGRSIPGQAIGRSDDGKNDVLLIKDPTDGVQP